MMSSLITGVAVRLWDRFRDQPWRQKVQAGLLPMTVGLAAGLSCLALIEVLAFVLNILPVPGLDGFGVIEPYLSDGARRLAERVRPWAPLVLLVVLLGLPGASRVLFGIGDVLFAAVGGNGALAGAGYNALLFWRR